MDENFAMEFYKLVDRVEKLHESVSGIQSLLAYQIAIEMLSSGDRKDHEEFIGKYTTFLQDRFPEIYPIFRELATLMVDPPPPFSK